MSHLRLADVLGVTLTTELAAALASRPLIEAVHLSPNTLHRVSAGVWETLAQLDNCFKSLGLTIWADSLDQLDPLQMDCQPVRRQLPPSLLALTGLGRLDLTLLSGTAFWDDYPEPRLGGLERMPLHTLSTDGGTPLEVWNCLQLSELRALNSPIAMPRRGHGPLPPLHALDLSCWWEGSFTADLCGLSCLTELSPSSCKFSSGVALPREVSQLRCATEWASH